VLLIKPLTIIAIGIAGGALGVLTVQPWHFISLPKGASTLEGCDRPSGYVSIVLDSSGFNNSGRSFPNLLQYKLGQTVNLLVCNLDSVDAHGLVIDHYFVTGVTLRPGQSYKISFVANDAGTFLIYCNVLCPVHDLMRAQLSVTN
jgi:heme/copper-type cytochrome/quinol oxidase subunit 2